MHFKCDGKRIVNIHIEMWDSANLGSLSSKILSFEGKEWLDFVKWAVINKLFMKVKILFGMFPGFVINFWNMPFIEAVMLKHKNQLEELQENISKSLFASENLLAVFWLKESNKEVSSKNPEYMLYENTSMDLIKKANGKIFNISINSKDALEIAKYFSATRNASCFVAKRDKKEENLNKLYFDPLFVSVPRMGLFEIPKQKSNDFNKLKEKYKSFYIAKNK